MPLRSFAASLIVLQLATAACLADDGFQAVQCEGAYPKHLQGICTNEVDAVYWSFTTVLVKTDTAGRVLRKASVADHHGDLCWHDGKVYVAVNLGQFNLPEGKADSWVYVYDGDTLVELARHRVSEVVHGAGGIAFREGRFFVVGGLPAGVKENYLYEYDAGFAFQKRHTLATGPTLKGIQTIATLDDAWWLGCYGIPRVTIQLDRDYRVLGKWELDTSLGIAPLADGRILVARGKYENKNGYTGELRLAVPDDKAGLRFLDESHKQ